MNSKTFFIAAFAAITTLSAGSAFADKTAFNDLGSRTSTVSRAEVIAETQRARAAGEITHGEQNRVIADHGPALSRAQVKAETLEAIRLGVIGHRERNEDLTAAQLDSIRKAGQKALSLSVASL